MQQKWKSSSFPAQRRACTTTAKGLIDPDKKLSLQKGFETVVHLETLLDIIVKESSRYATQKSCNFIVNK